jgi:hypothetical protein
VEEAAGRASPRRLRDGCHGTPAQVKSASGVAGDDAEASPLTSPGNPRRKAGARRGDAQSPIGGPGGRSPPTKAGQLDSAAGQMFDKIKPENDQTVVPPCGGTVEDNSPPRPEHLGRIESPPNPGCSSTAERLPWPAASFDLVVSTTSFDHWADQRAGLAECARVLAPGGCLVLADLFSVLLLPTLLAGRGGKARTRRRAAYLLTVAGLHSPHWHRLYAVIIQAVTATK